MSHPWQQFEYRVGVKSAFFTKVTLLYFLSFVFDHAVQMLLSELSRFKGKEWLIIRKFWEIIFTHQIQQRGSRRWG